MNHQVATTDLAWAGVPPTSTHLLDHGVREETIRFNNDLAQGYYHDIYLEGIHIGYGELQPARALRLLSHQPAPMLELHFLLEGVCASQLDSLETELLFRGGESNLLFLPGQSGQHEVVAGQHYREFEIHLSGPFFQRLADVESGPLALLAPSIQAGIPALLQLQHLAVNATMRGIMQQILDCPLQGAGRRFLLEAKVMELLALQLAQATAAPAPPSEVLRLHSADVEKLHVARDLIIQNLSQPPSLGQLAVLCGLNEFKLKKGFKQLFGDTVYGYLLHYKLEQGRRCLLDSEMAVADVAESVGYRHASHFTAAFKKKYGVLPKDIRHCHSALLKRDEALAIF